MGRCTQFFLLVFIAYLAGLNESITAQVFYFGADQSYVNEMEDCGAVYHENGEVKDVHQIFADHGCNLVRLRLWHTPVWYDQLNAGKRYSDLTDVKKSIRRIKGQGMETLLDFHLSDNWADPSKQLVPAAWLDVVDSLDLLKDSLYHYIFKTLSDLHAETLLPELVQIGNETNRGILLSPEDNKEWTLDWDRNVVLFQSAIAAVRDFSNSKNEEVKIVLHFAGPAETEWYVNEFVTRGVVDFDIIGISYYWAWHKPTTIADAGLVIKNLQRKFPSKEVIIVETGYIWTTESNDNAGNIISDVHPDYSPASPENQRKWLIDLTQTVIDQGGRGVIYWEPSWVSTPCWNQWNQGSHQEHATFFDFDNNLLIPGGIQFMEHEYQLSTTIPATATIPEFSIDHQQRESKAYLIVAEQLLEKKYGYSLADTTGHILLRGIIDQPKTLINLEIYPSGIYYISLTDGEAIGTKKLVHISN